MQENKSRNSGHEEYRSDTWLVSSLYSKREIEPRVRDVSKTKLPNLYIYSIGVCVNIFHWSITFIFQTQNGSMDDWLNNSKSYNLVAVKIKKKMWSSLETSNRHESIPNLSLTVRVMATFTTCRYPDKIIFEIILNFNFPSIELTQLTKRL